MTDILSSSGPKALWRVPVWTRQKKRWIPRPDRISILPPVGDQRGSRELQREPAGKGIQSWYNNFGRRGVRSAGTLAPPLLIMIQAGVEVRQEHLMRVVWFREYVLVSFRVFLVMWDPCPCLHCLMAWYIYYVSMMCDLLVTISWASLVLHFLHLYTLTLLSWGYFCGGAQEDGCTFRHLSSREILTAIANISRRAVNALGDCSKNINTRYSRRVVYSLQELFKLSVKAVDTIDATLLQTYQPDSSGRFQWEYSNVAKPKIFIFS